MKVHYPKLYNMAHLLALYFNASKGSNNYFYSLLLQLVLCRVAALKSLPVHHPKCRLYFTFDPLGSVNIYEVFQFFICKNHLLNSILIIWPLWEFESLI